MNKSSVGAVGSSTLFQRIKEDSHRPVHWVIERHWYGLSVKPVGAYELASAPLCHIWGSPGED